MEQIFLIMNTFLIIQPTLTSKKFGRFYFRAKPCPKIKLSEIFQVRTLKASENFPRKQY